MSGVDHSVAVKNTFVVVAARIDKTLPSGGARMTVERRELNRALRTLAERYAAAAAAALGPRLVSAVLFGSVVRGEAGPASDLDLFLVVRDLPAGRFRRLELVEPVRDRLEQDLAAARAQGWEGDLSVILRTPAEAARFHVLYLDMTRESVVLYDAQGFFAGLLDRVRARLAELGARRVYLGRAWYWDLKPDFRPGEVIEL